MYSKNHNTRSKNDNRQSPIKSSIKTKKRKHQSSLSRMAPSPENSLKKQKTMKRSIYCLSKNITTEIIHNTPIEWREPFSNKRTKSNIIKPIFNKTIPRIGIFLRFFKRILMEPPVRKYFISKYNPTFDYYLYRIDYIDKSKDKKVEEIKRIFETNKTENPQKNIIIDVAEQLEKDGPGHWTTMKYENGILLYMDSDPFAYGSQAEKQHKSFHTFIRTLDLPKQIYGTHERTKSIQRLNENDTFCQSWSLLYDTTINDFPNMPDIIKFETVKLGTNNLENFLHNFLFLITFWKKLFTDKNGNPDLLFDKLISGSQWKYWNSDSVIEYLNKTNNFIVSNRKKILTDKEMEEDIFFQMGEHENETDFLTI